MSEDRKIYSTSFKMYRGHEELLQFLEKKGKMYGKNTAIIIAIERWFEAEKRKNYERNGSAEGK